jgi:hypothetical protein
LSGVDAESVAEGINFVIRLNLGGGQLTLIDAEGRSIKLWIAEGEERTCRQLLCGGVKSRNSCKNNGMGA